METFFTIQSGSIVNKKTIAEAFALEDGRYRLRIDSYKKRSLKQNDYWWGCLLPLAKDGLREAGWNNIRTINDAHDFIKELFLKEVIRNEKTGEEKTRIKSTAKLSTKEFNVLIDETIQWAAEYLSIQIPYPNEPLVMFAEYKQDDNLILITGE